jgi:hypothetical protein
MRKAVAVTVAAALMAVAGSTISGSSHREAPGIAKTPKVDGTDFYMFRSYEPGRASYVTFLANYIGLEDVYGGPNFFNLDDEAVYEIHVDNNGNGVEDLTFQFQFQRTQKNLAVSVGNKMTAVPLINIGGIGPGRDDTGNLNVLESYTLNLVRGGRRTGQKLSITDVATGSTTFKKPVDRLGDKSLRDNAAVYDQYANNHIYNVNIPGCPTQGRVFVGQRREGFVVNLGEVFDLINLNPLGPENGRENTLADKNVTTLALEVPIACLVASDPVIGAWTTSSVGKGTPASDSGGGSSSSPCPAGTPSAPQPNPSFVPTEDCNGWVPPNHPLARGNSSSGGNSSSSSGSADCPAGFPATSKPAADFLPTNDCLGWVPPNHPAAKSGATSTPPGQFTQVSRLGHPLVNEVIIGLPDKDKFNASEPKDDVQFLDYVTHPSLPVLIQALFGVAPPVAPRNDLVTVFLTGVPGLNQPANVSPAEILRVNTNIAPTVEASQNRLGVIGGDAAGFPNGRRPGDDVVDVALRVVEGALCGSSASGCTFSTAPLATFPALTDGAINSATVAYDPDGTVSADPNLRLFRNSFPYLRLPLTGSPNPTHQ